MNHTKMIAAAMKEARKLLEASGDSFDDDDVAETASDLLAEWECDAAQDRMLNGIPEDTPCIQSANLYGTGEGQFHGIIG